MAIQLTKSDVHFASSRLFYLEGGADSQILEGTISFRCWFDKEKSLLEHNSAKVNALEDVYFIRINFNEQDDWGLPKVYEIGNKIKNHASQKSVELSDLHVNTGGDCCLGIFHDYEWKGILDFFDKKIISFFYWQTHYRVYGEEPWIGYSHGSKGIEEAMTLVPSQAGKGRNRNMICECRSGKKYKNCCLVKDVKLKAKLIKK